MATPKPKPLSCGGKGPCCHIGYAHRHCEHCDTVVPTGITAAYPWVNPVYPRPYQPMWWGNGAVNAAAATHFAQALQGSAKVSAADSSYNVGQSLPSPVPPTNKPPSWPASSRPQRA